MRQEDSGVYICKAENNEGVTEVKVDISVHGGPGAPVASVSPREMTVVEGHMVTMACQATGTTSSFHFLSLLISALSSHCLFVVRFTAPCHHVVQAESPVTMETHHGGRRSDSDQRGPPGLGPVHLQCHQHTRLQRGVHADGGGQ